jgi:hypothetical protein
MNSFPFIIIAWKSTQLNNGYPPWTMMREKVRKLLNFSVNCLMKEDEFFDKKVQNSIEFFTFFFKDFDFQKLTKRDKNKTDIIYVQSLDFTSSLDKTLKLLKVKYSSLFTFGLRFP